MDSTANGGAVITCPGEQPVVIGASGAHATLVRVENEPAGANCPNGGVAVESGVDENGDGVLEDGEVTSTQYVCSAGASLLSGVLNDSYTIHSAVDAALLADVTVIEGTLTIDADGLTDLALPNLTRIGMDLVVDSDAALATIGLPALTTVGGSVTIANDPALTSLAGLGALATIGGNLDVRTNAQLTSLTGLEGLRTVGGTLYVRDEAALASIASLAGVTSASAIEVSQVPLLKDLTGLSGLSMLPVGFRLNQAALVPDLAPLSTLTTVGALQISLNPALTSLHGLEQLVTTGSIDLEENTQLTSIAALSSVTSTAALGVDGNTALASLHGLEKITSLSQDLSVQADPLLVDLSPLAALTSVRSIYVSDDTMLTSIGLTALTSVSVDFAFTGDTALPECLVDALVAKVGAPATVTTTGNGTGTCP